MKDFHVKKPGDLLWTALDRNELDKQIGGGVIQRDWQIFRDGESDITTVGEFLELAQQVVTTPAGSGPAADTNQQKPLTNLQGIGGWLILIVIGLVVTPIRIGITVYNTYVPIFSGETWSLLTTPGAAAYNPMWKPILLFEIFGNLIFLFSSVALLFLLFGRKRIFPRLMIAFYIANLLFVGLDLVAASSIPTVASQADASSTMELVRSILVCAVWVPYFLVSERVKQTFTQ